MIDMTCPVCGEYTLHKPEGWVEGGPLVCANDMCESNYPPRNICGARFRDSVCGKPAGHMPPCVPRR